MKSYFELQKSRSNTIFPNSEIKEEAEAREIENQCFKECGCIPRSIRETAIDRRILALAQESGKTEITLLSIGSGNLGQEYHINKLLTDNGIFVQWLLVDPEYGRTEASWDLLKAFKQSMEETGSGVLGAYSDISAYTAFKLGRSEFSALSRSDAHQHLFTKKWLDFFNDHPLNAMIFNRKHGDFSSKPLPPVDLVLAIDLNPTGTSGYQKTKELTALTLEAVHYLNPEASTFSVVNTKSQGARSEADLEIDTIQSNQKPSSSTRFR